MKPILFLYGNAARNFEGDASEILSAYPQIVIDHQSHEDLRGMGLTAPHAEALRLYTDSLGASYRSMVDFSPPAYFPGPADWGAPDIVSERGVHCYRIDLHHVRRFMLAVWALANSQALEVGGIFLDDFFPTAPPPYWHLDPVQRRKAWPGEDTWITIMRELEATLRAILGLRGMKLLVNGPAWLAPRLWESAGEWVSPKRIATDCRPGDAILVKGLKADGAHWAETVQDPEISGYDVGTSFRDVFLDCLAIAQKMDLSLGLCYRETPEGGGSVANIHSLINPKSWEAI